MLWARLTSTFGALWTELMEEVERNAQPLKQGAVTAVVFAAVMLVVLAPKLSVPVPMPDKLAAVMPAAVRVSAPRLLKLS